MTDVFNEDDLTVDRFLGGKLSLLQPRHGYRAGTDPVFLAAACPAVPGQAVLELGCGAGTALLCLRHRVAVIPTGVERQANYADLAVRNFERNGFAADIQVSDLGNLPPDIRDKTFDHVILNPPFFKGGRKASDQGRALGRQEDTGLDIWIDQALRRVKPNGHITLIHLTERMSDIIALLNPRVGDIEIKPLAARIGREPKRIVIRARKGSMGATTLYNPLIIHDGLEHAVDRDSTSLEARSILQNGFSLKF
jgi:tRNA1(Val) A37 N6-methylase TrmN6